MRALCGAIIAAGSFIGLGLLAIGIGTRYNAVGMRETEFVHIKDVDTALLFVLVFLTITALIGLAIAFVGLAYHHHRRYHEHLRAFPPNTTESARATV
jgi:hypothetical protein